MISKNIEETFAYAGEFAKKLKGGETIALIGDLGSGKTTFVKGLAEELKIAEQITSPTFVILKSYIGKIGKENIDFIHIDAYRLETREDAESIGLNDFLGKKDCILIIEWAEKIEEMLPKNTIFINFNHKSENEREIIVKKS